MKKRLIFASVLAGLILTFGLGGNAMASGESLGKCSVDEYTEKYRALPSPEGIQFGDEYKYIPGSPHLFSLVGRLELS